jgi:anti-sigma factor RsiW
MTSDTKDLMRDVAKRTRRTGCPLQDDVLAMRRGGGASPTGRHPSPTSPEPVEGRGPLTADRRAALEAHLAGCPDCRRAMAVDGALAQLAAEPPGVVLPDPGSLYWRARVLGRLAERSEAAERAARPLRWVHAAGAVLAALLATLLLGWLGGGLLTALEKTAAVLGGAAVDPSLLQLAVWMGLALLAGAGLMAAHTLVEER